MDNLIRILVVDDHTITRKGLSSLLNAMPQLQVVGEASCGSEMILMLRESHPDVLLIDSGIFQKEGPSLVWRTCQEFPGVVILILFHSAENSPFTLELDSSQISFTSKDMAPEELALAIQGIVTQ